MLVFHILVNIFQSPSSRSFEIQLSPSLDANTSIILRIRRFSIPNPAPHAPGRATVDKSYSFAP